MYFPGACLFIFAIAGLLPAGSGLLFAQSVLHYTFKPGERLRYHYKISSTVDQMGKRGNRESETDFEADPEWYIEDLSMEGEARAILTVYSRSENYVNGKRRLNFLHMTPQSEIAMDKSGRLVYGKILIDDTQRTITKKIVGVVPGVHLMADQDVLLPYFERLWFTLDPLPIDTLGTPYIRNFDTTIARPYEHDTMVYARMDTFLTAAMNPYQYRGKSTYTLRDTTVDNHHFWSLRYVTDAESFWVRYPKLRPNESHRVTDILFRKQDGLIQSWHYTLENHNGASESNSEMWLKLTSIEGD